MGAVSHYVKINAPARQCYDWWRPLTHLPKILPDVEKVEPHDGDPDLTTWTVKGPAGKSVSWQARVVDDEPGHKVAWATLDSADPDVSNAGVVRFDDQDGDTTGFEISFEYDPPGGKIGEAAAALFADPQEKVEAAAKQFKQLMEAGQ